MKSAPHSFAALTIPRIFSSVSSIHGSTGIIKIPAKIPASLSFARASNRSDDRDTPGSIFLQRVSSQVVIVSLQITGECSFISSRMSMSLVIMALFVAMALPKPKALISSWACLVSISSFSKGLYGSLMAPVATTPFFVFLLRSSRIISMACSFAFT